MNTSIKFLVFSFVFIIYISECNANTPYICSGPVKPTLQYASVADHDNSGRITKRASSGRFRFTVHYTDNFLNVRDSTLVKAKIIRPALYYWEQRMKVKFPQGGETLLSRSCTHNAISTMTHPNGTKEQVCFYGCEAITKCSDAVVPQTYVKKCVHVDATRTRFTHYGTDGTGFPRDGYLLFVDSTNTQRCSNDVNLLGYATSCQQDPDTDRPIVGYINMCPKKLDLKYPTAMSLVGTARHELSHALGFSKYYFAYLRDERNQPRTRRNVNTNKPDLGEYDDGTYISDANTMIVKKVWWQSKKGWQEVTRKILTLPILRKAAREHYKCPDLAGVELEDDGGSSSAYSHFENRVANDELMSPVSVEVEKGDLFTLSYFADTNWYTMRLDLATPMRWGKNLGCDFVHQSCYQFMNDRIRKRQSHFPWCNKLHEIRCLADHTAYGMCDISRYSSPLSAEEQQLFDVKGIDENALIYYGGGVRYRDGCATYNTLIGTEGEKHTTYCKHSQNNVLLAEQTNRGQQKFGRKSLCFDRPKKDYIISTVNNVRYYLSQEGASCFLHECKSGNLFVTVLGRRFQCPSNGGIMNINQTRKDRGFEGDIICPSPRSICLGRN